MKKCNHILLQKDCKHCNKILEEICKGEYDNFWKEIIYTKGKLDEKKVLAELSDYSFLLNEVPKVYMAVTGGMLSKTNYYADVVITQFEDKFYDKGIVQDDIQELLKNSTNFDQLKEDLKDYFNI